MMKTKTLDKPTIVALLSKNDKAVCRALVVLNQYQTLDEQATEDTRHRNGMGFKPCHARMGTSMAKFYSERGYLSPKQIAYWRKTDRRGNMRIGIYWKQLIRAAGEKQQSNEKEI
jgi:hypothetical protein